MRELLRTNDLMKLSWAQTLLADNNIETVVLDGHASNLCSTDVIERRLMVVDEDEAPARRIIQRAEESIKS